MPTTVAVRDTTKAKLDRIADRNRWSLIETVDALADAYLDSFPDASLPPKTHESKRNARRVIHHPATVA